MTDSSDPRKLIGTPTHLAPVPPEKRRARLYVDGEPFPGSPATLQLRFYKRAGAGEDELIGAVDYGLMTATGYDTWCWGEAGGSVVVPFMFAAGRLYVARVLERRPLEMHPSTPEGMTLNAPRGRAETGQALFEVAAAELAEEMGEIVGGTTILDLGGEIASAETAWFRYFDRPDGSKGGVGFFGVYVPPDVLTTEDAGRTYVFKPNTLKTRQRGSIGEKILAATFVPWTEAAFGRCMMTMAGVSRLMAALFAREAIDVFQGAADPMCLAVRPTPPAPPPVVSSAPPAPGGPALPGVV